MHLSFYQVSSRGGSVDKVERDCPPRGEIGFPSYNKNNKNHLRLEKWVRRAVMSFRFDRDFFDRFWTCHFLEHDPDNSSKKLEELDVRPREVDGLGLRLRAIDEPSARPKLIDDHQKQHRVLELVLFDSILQRMINATDGILEEARERVSVAVV